MSNFFKIYEIATYQIGICFRYWLLEIHFLPYRSLRLIDSGSARANRSEKSTGNALTQSTDSATTIRFVRDFVYRVPTSIEEQNTTAVKYQKCVIAHAPTWLRPFDPRYDPPSDDSLSLLFITFLSIGRMLPHSLFLLSCALFFSFTRSHSFIFRWIRLDFFLHAYNLYLIIADFPFQILFSIFLLIFPFIEC